MEVQLLTIVSGLGICCFAACVSRLGQLKHYAAGLLIVGLLTGLRGANAEPMLTYDPAHLAIMIALGALFFLQSEPWPVLVALVSGGLTAVWIAMLKLQGVPVWFSAPLALALSLATFYCTLFRSGFVSEPVRQEAMLVLLAIAVLAGLVPGLLTSWRAATRLQSADAALDATEAQSMCFFAILVFFGAGFLFAAWRGRSRSNQLLGRAPPDK